jgi:hypothetical protein
LLLDKSARKVVAGRNLVLFNELSKVLRVFQDHGIPVIVLKGAALANSVYDSIGERPMSDVDLLVHPEDREKIIAMLEQAGYEFKPWPVGNFHPFNINYTGEIDFLAKSGTDFDLHWNLISFEWVRLLNNLDVDAIWRAAQPLAIDGIMTLQLGPCDMLIHVCLHSMMQGYTHRVACQDIVTLVKYHQPFLWKEFVERVADFRLRSTCYFALEAVSMENASIIPPEVLTDLNPPSWKKWLIHRIADPIKCMQGQIMPGNRKYLVQLITADRPWDVVKVLFWLFFPGPKWLEERYRLRNRIESWLACLWHPLVVVRRGLMGMWEVIK